MRQTYSQHHAKWWKTETISSKVMNKTRMFTLPTLTQYSPGFPSQSNTTGGKNKRDSYREGGSQIILICG
jgi:hypothetical protein